jgi:hypothetical protein
MFPVVNPALGSNKSSEIMDQTSGTQPTKKSRQPHKLEVIQDSECYLMSVCGLREAVITGKHNGACFLFFETTSST